MTANAESGLEPMWLVQSFRKRAREREPERDDAVKPLSKTEEPRSQKPKVAGSS
jgi:hypothetical protein